MHLVHLYRRLALAGATCLLSAFFAPAASAALVTINFDDVVGSNVDITNRYPGVTLNAIDNPFPLAGIFPASAAPPPVQGGAETWTDGFASATSPTQVAVASDIASTTQPGQGGILMSFGVDIDFLSLVGVDNGTTGGADDESVTLTAWNAAGNLLGQAFSNTNLAGAFDQTPAMIALPGMRFVAFNYTDTQFGFYAIDDLTYNTVIPEPGSAVLLGLGLVVAAAARKRSQVARG